jgi:hypothetical protein
VTGPFRKVFDSLMAGGLLLLAFYAGILSNEVAQHRKMLIDIQQERGKVKISIEAAERLSCLESKVPECKR